MGIFEKFILISESYENQFIEKINKVFTQYPNTEFEIKVKYSQTLNSFNRL